MFSFLRFQISPSPLAFDFRSRLAGDRPFSQILAFRKSGFHLGPPVRELAYNLRRISDSRRKHILFLEYSILLFYWKVFLGIFFFAFPPLIFSEESRIGATFETYNSRYLRNEKENWFFKTSNCPLKLKKPSEEFPSCRYAFFETRDGRPFFSVQWENRFGRASAGHRFRPLENFYFLRDNDFYTALPEIEQAIHRSAFVHLKFAGWAFGSFYSEAEARKRGGYFLISPRRIFEFAYAPELGTHYASLDFKSKNFDLPGPKIVSRIQTFGIKKEWDGTFYTSVFSQRLDSEFRATGYRGKGRDLFAIDPDRGELDGKASLARFGITSHSYFSLEWIRAWKKSLPVEAPFPAFFPNSAEPTSSDFRRWQIVGGKAPLYFGEFGGILFSLRNYNQGSSETLGRGLYYSLQKRNFSIEAGQEWRTNGDSITEGKWSFRLDESWNLEGAFLFQKEGNQTDSLFEARTARDETSLIFTDRNSSFRLRLLSPYIAFTVSHSRKKENKSDGIWINLQVQFPF
ncbi:hypothetical protein CH380_10595 [Leptospira adleri]|uniref:Uncharacterized protein n=1 Tax=Leptospira adleri TaxID=2023186 RepID=A0A2M9YP37_9LEPT|nr:hypothetical protein CH380_10595 [Leptospira adleri]PJZ63942.1 hypothetical protein CH376_00515 [Leptospira adleri]